MTAGKHASDLDRLPAEPPDSVDSPDPVDPADSVDSTISIDPAAAISELPVEPADPAGPTDRAEQRADTLRKFKLLAAADPGGAEHAALREELIADHMNYARYVAARFSAPPGATEDLAQVAYLALVKAVDNYDPEYGVAFIGYVTPMITGEIKRYFRDSTWDVHVPRRMQELSLALRGATEQLAHELGRSPTVDELADELSATVEEVVEAVDAANAYSAASLDRPVDSGDEHGVSLGEFMGGEDAGFDGVIDRTALKPLLARLPERDKRILMMRFFRGMTQSQIAEEIGVSQMQVSRLLTRILTELREGLDL
jgi:RNA polymerase sigma-B factor